MLSKHGIVIVKKRNLNKNAFLIKNSPPSHQNITYPPVGKA